VEPFAHEFTRDRFGASPPPLWGRIKEGGCAVRRDKMQHLIRQVVSLAGATPHPCRPHKRARVRKRHDYPDAANAKTLLDSIETQDALGVQS